MTKPSFFLKRPNADKTSIWVHYRCDNGPLKYYTDITVSPKEWNKTNQVASRKGINARLIKIANTINLHVDNCRMAEAPVLKENLKAALDRSEGKGEKAGQPSLFDQWRQVIAKMKSGDLLTPGTKKKYEASTIKTFDALLGKVEKFRPGLKTRSFTMDLYQEFIAWGHSQGYSTNYIGAQIKVMARLCRISGVTLPAEFKKIKEDTYDIYLSEEEISQIYQQPTITPGSGHVRDWFIIDCYTGLRVGDLTALTSRNITGNFITIANAKTDEKVVIPVHPYVKEILKKYNGFPPKVTDQYINREIKEIAKDAGLKSTILYTITKGGRRVDHYLEKWKMVSCHTSRRSFITNLRKNGVPDSIVMKLTGIRSPATLKRYDKISPEEAATLAAKMNFFKGRSTQ